MTDTAKDANPADEVDDSAPRDYNLPIPSRKAIPEDYEHDNDDKKYDKVEGGNILVVESG